MIQVNLLPVEERGAAGRLALRIPKKGFWLTLVLSAAIVLPVVGIGVMQRVKIASLRADLERAEAESRRLKPQIERIQALMRERSDVNQRLLTVQGLARDRYLPVQVMDELADQTPEALWFTKFDQKSTGELELQGMTFSNIVVSELMSRMEEADVFQDVALTVSERPKGGDPRLMKFTLVTRIRP